MRDSNLRSDPQFLEIPEYCRCILETRRTISSYAGADVSGGPRP
jgi:hypothetical protein